MLLPGLLILVSFAGISQTPAETQPQTAIAQASALRDAGKLSEARDAFEEILATSPDDMAAQSGEVQVSERMALDARAAGRVDDALADLLRAQKLAPENARLLYDLGILEDEMRLYLDADKTLAHLEQLSPADPLVQYAVARVKLDLGQLGPAEEKMQAYLKVHPDDASAHYGLGRAYQQGVQLDQARAEFQRSIELRPQQTEAYYQLGEIAIQQGNYPEALANFSKTLAGNPKHGGALVGTGVVYFKQKQYDKAEEFLEKATGASPDYQPGHYYLGLTLARLGRKEESDRELAVATKLADRDNQQTANRLRLIDPATKQ
jgi:tetratricopeptide (TPR) repeat protein